MGRIAEAAEDARRCLELARELGDPAVEVGALLALSVAAGYADDLSTAVRLARQAQQVPADIPGWLARGVSEILTAGLIKAGDLAVAEETCAAGLARCREAGDLYVQASLLAKLAILDVRAGRIEIAAAHLREALRIGTLTGSRRDLLYALYSCGYLCAATGRHAEALTVWAADAAIRDPGFTGPPADVRRQQQVIREARHVLGPARARAAEERGAAMSRDIAAEYVFLLTTPGSQPPAAAPGPVKLSARERELITLVAQGRTNAQIAAQLYISGRTVTSHLDRIRDKTGCRRRVDLTRLALSEGLV